MARWLLPVVLLALLPASASAAPLTGTSWRATQIGKQAVGEFKLTLDFTSARRFAGFDGCNHFSGDYRTSGSRLRFRHFISTAIGCEGDTLPNFVSRLMRARRYVVAGRRLTLRRGDRTLVVLRRR